jgi:hypothetical protein
MERHFVKVDIWICRFTSPLSFDLFFRSYESFISSTNDCMIESGFFQYFYLMTCTKKIQFCFFAFLFVLSSYHSFAQIKWQNVDSLYQPLPKTVHVYFTDDAIDTGKFKAFYLVADLKDKKLDFTTDITFVFYFFCV